jgi:cytochrome c-type biogenesis protein CcmF
VAVLRPEQRTYPVERQSTSEAAIHSTVWGDLYAVLGDPVDDGGGFSVRLYHNPLVTWIFAGAALMGFAGLLSLTDRRLRVGAPTPAARAKAGTGAAQPAGA